MKDKNIINELRKLDILISKKMFKESKLQNVNRPPSPLQFKILNYLLENKNSVVKQCDLEKKFDVSRAAISEALFTMEKNKIINRVSSDTDARSKNIELTDKSIERFKEMENISKKMNDKLMNGINEKDLNKFFEVLEIMKENLSEFN